MEVYTAKQVAEILKIHPDTVKALLRAGKIKGFRVNKAERGQWRITREEIEKYVSGNGKKS